MEFIGYKLRRHIAKALQTRSRTIRSALARYNTVAASMSPPRRSLKWDEVIDFTFLADFDILRDPEGNALLRPWATPAARELMDTHFKIKRAKEEIQRLNIEIRRLVTYIRDEKEFLLKKEAEVKETDPHLAFFVRRYRNLRGRFDEVHTDRLKKMVKKLGHRFTGTLVPGIQLVPEQPSEELEMEVEGCVEEGEETKTAEDEGWVSEHSDNEEGEDYEDEQLAEAMETVMVLATDKEEGEKDEWEEEWEKDE